MTVQLTDDMMCLFSACNKVDLAIENSKIDRILGASGCVVGVNLARGTVDLDGDIGCVPVTALKGYGCWVPPQAACQTSSADGKSVTVQQEPSVFKSTCENLAAPLPSLPPPKASSQTAVPPLGKQPVLPPHPPPLCKSTSIQPVLSAQPPPPIQPSKPTSAQKVAEVESEFVLKPGAEDHSPDAFIKLLLGDDQTKEKELVSAEECENKDTAQSSVSKKSKKKKKSGNEKEAENPTPEELVPSTSTDLTDEAKMKAAVEKEERRVQARESRQWLKAMRECGVAEESIDFILRKKNALDALNQAAINAANG